MANGNTDPLILDSFTAGTHWVEPRTGLYVIKVKLSLCLTKHCAMKMYEEVGV
jgi:hypothetical protein